MERERIAPSCVVNSGRQRSRFHLRRVCHAVEYMPFDAHGLHATVVSAAIAKIFSHLNMSLAKSSVVQ